MNFHEKFINSYCLVELKNFNLEGISLQIKNKGNYILEKIKSEFKEYSYFKYGGILFREQDFI
jgi:hypothetical protein